MTLPWNFEAFRRFLAFDVIQQACATILPFNGSPLFQDQTLMSDFTNRLYQRTGLEWMPKREVSDGVIFNIEGSVFRNKARVFTSLYLVDPDSLDHKENVIVTEFGKAIGLGHIDETNFYKEVISRFEYPHPAYDENWESWIAAKKKLRPFLYILDIMINLYQKDLEGSINVDEIARVAFENPDHTKAKYFAKEILQMRTKKSLTKRKSNDQTDRKIGDILGFLCMSGFAFYDGNRIALNLLDRHKNENTFFWQSRNHQNSLESLIAFVDSGIRDLK